MIQTHTKLVEIGTEYNTLFSKNEFYPIQKAYTTPHFICLGVRFPGQNVVIYIGRGNKYEGVFFANKFPPSFLRIQDRFLDYLRKYLVGSKIGKINIDSKRPFFYWSFKTDHEHNALGFGYKDHQLFFARKNNNEIFTSWNNENVESSNLEEVMNGFLKDHLLLTKEHESQFTIEQYIEEEFKKVSGKIVQKKKEKFLDRKIKNISKDLDEVKVWEEIEGELLSGELAIKEGVTQEIKGQKIKFTSGMNEWQKRDVIFTKVKKLKRAESILGERLIEANSELAKVNKGDFEFETTKEKAIALLWSFGHSQKVKSSSKYQIKDFILGKLRGSIGLDAESNDELRSHSNKEHFWLHIENYPGAHCMVKTENFQEISSLELEALASMMRDFSKLEILEIPIIYSQLKHVKGQKGQKGMVLIKKPKYLRLNYRNWKEIITLIE